MTFMVSLIVGILVVIATIIATHIFGNMKLRWYVARGQLNVVEVAGAFLLPNTKRPRRSIDAMGFYLDGYEVKICSGCMWVEFENNEAVRDRGLVVLVRSIKERVMIGMPSYNRNHIFLLLEDGKDKPSLFKILFQMWKGRDNTLFR